MTFAIGDVVQVTDKEHEWFALVLVVDAALGGFIEVACYGPEVPSRRVRVLAASQVSRIGALAVDEAVMRGRRSEAVGPYGAKEACSLDEFEALRRKALTSTVPAPERQSLVYRTSVFWEVCPDCGAEIASVQFGGQRVGYGEEYRGFIFVQYACRANYYFNDRARTMSEDSVLCPSTLKACLLCGNKIGRLVCTRGEAERLAPFCSDGCAIKWARANVPEAAPAPSGQPPPSGVEGWPFPWPEPSGPHAHYQTNGPAEAVEVAIEGHLFTVVPTEQVGITTGRVRFSIGCTTCRKQLHPATTSPPSVIRAHLRETRR